MEIKQKEVVRSTFYLADIQDIFEYGEATFGEKAALFFYGLRLLKFPRPNEPLPRYCSKQ